MPTMKQALYALSQHYDLSLVLELEPRIEDMVKMALACIALGDTKEHVLPDVEAYATRLVGSNALHPMLRTAKYEQALHAFVEWVMEREGEG